MRKLIMEKSLGYFLRITISTSSKHKEFQSGLEALSPTQIFHSTNNDIIFYKGRICLDSVNYLKI